MGDCRLRPVEESDLDCFEAEFSDRAGVGEFQWRAGAWHDQVLYSVLRQEAASIQ